MKLFKFSDMNVVVSGNLFPLSIEIKRGEAYSSKEDSS